MLAKLKVRSIKELRTHVVINIRVHSPGSPSCSPQLSLCLLPALMVSTLCLQLHQGQSFLIHSFLTVIFGQGLLGGTDDAVRENHHLLHVQVSLRPQSPV